jgi:DNA polymerase
MTQSVNANKEIEKLLVFFKEIGAHFVEIDKSFLDKTLISKNYNLFKQNTKIVEKEKKENYNPTITDSMNNINNDIFKCTACPLVKTKNNFVTGEGSLKPDIMFIGEGPGQEEDKTGKPFVGNAGMLLEKIINKMGYKRESVFIANIVKCRPPNNRPPYKEEAERCLPFLKRQITLLKPKAIVCLGKTATNFLLDKNISITRVRGTEFNFNGIPVIPTFHPSYILHIKQKEAVSKAKWEVWSDMEKVLTILKR